MLRRIIKSLLTVVAIIGVMAWAKYDGTGPSDYKRIMMGTGALAVTLIRKYI